jgi:hypothetical protein
LLTESFILTGIDFPLSKGSTVLKSLQYFWFKKLELTFVVQNNTLVRILFQRGVGTIQSWFFFFFFCLHYAAQDGLEVMILLHQFSKCWDYRHELLNPDLLAVFLYTAAVVFWKMLSIFFFIDRIRRNSYTSEWRFETFIFSLSFRSNCLLLCVHFYFLVSFLTCLSTKLPL